MLIDLEEVVDDTSKKEGSIESNSIVPETRKLLSLEDKSVTATRTPQFEQPRSTSSGLIGWWTFEDA